MAGDDDAHANVLRLVPGHKSRKEDRADRFLAALIILTQGGVAVVRIAGYIIVLLLAAVGVVSLIGR